MAITASSTEPDRVFQTYRDGDLTALAADLGGDDRFEQEPYASVTMFSADGLDVLLYDELRLVEIRSDQDQDGTVTDQYDLSEYGFEHHRTAWYDDTGTALVEWEDGDLDKYRPQA